MHRVTIIPNFNQVVAVEAPGADGISGNLDLSDLNLEGVHAAHLDPATGMVDVEYIKPANERMTLEEFHSYFGEVTKKPRKKTRRHLDEAVETASAAVAEEKARRAAAEDDR